MDSITDGGGHASVGVSWQTMTRLVELARRAGQAILARGCGTTEIKADGSPVTSADRLAHEIICAEAGRGAALRGAVAL